MGNGGEWMGTSGEIVPYLGFYHKDSTIYNQKWNFKTD